MRNRRNSNVMFYLFFPIALFYMEIVLKIYCFGKLFDVGLLYTLLFTIPIGIIIALLSGVWGKKANRVVSIVVLFIATLALEIQTVYYTIFKTFTTLYSITGAGEAVGEFGQDMFAGILKAIIPLSLILIPFIFLLIFGNRFTPIKRPSRANLILIFLAIITSQLVGLAFVKSDDAGIMSSEYVYSDFFSPILSVPRFGVLTTLRLDIQNMFNIVDETVNPIDSESPNTSPDVSTDPSDSSPDVSEVVYGPHVLEIDFDALIANETDSKIIDMHEYFSNVESTYENEYTGMFEGYNLIWIVAEGFSSLALDETHTPTLYKMAHEGFVFENFYNPVWGVSTSDGEYVATTSLIPKAGVWSYSKSAENDMPFGFGNMFSALGYSARAYHNHTYTYYDRDSSYPNMGYDYKAVGHGLDIKSQWPESDLEMMEVTVPEYIQDEHFLTYYMTVSGHMNYTFLGNMMAYIHKNDVADLPYSEGPRAYIACQMEFDLSMEYLISELTKAGVLENTVIVISGDHYPYGLEVSQMEEVTGETMETNFELYRSTLMIWNSEMETIPVEKYCSSLDIMPTLANLFGLEYDSRLFMGTDILSDTDPLVIFSNRSFITDMGRYNSSTDTFTANEGVSVPEGYARSILQIVNNKFTYSAAILDHDYYHVLFKDD